MKIIKREFLSSDFEKVRDFLTETYSSKSSNWTIERWSWSRYVNGYWLENFETWPSSVGMWVDVNDDIVAIVSSEGEKDGDVFFQLKDQAYNDDFLHEIITYGEEHLCKDINGTKYLYPRLNNICKERFSKVLTDRGYTYSGDYETDSTIELDQYFKVELPIGFHLELASKYSAGRRGEAHGKAFSVDLDRIEALKDNRIRAYTGLLQSPDYTEALDLCVIDEEGTIATFATFWFDPINRIGALEPLGTIKDYWKMGLGKAIVYEGLNRLKKMGATKVHVGSSQQFYKNIGFKVELETEIWKKTLL